MVVEPPRSRSSSAAAVANRTVGLRVGGFSVGLALAGPKKLGREGVRTVVVSVVGLICGAVGFCCPLQPLLHQLLPLVEVVSLPFSSLVLPALMASKASFVCLISRTLKEKGFISSRGCRMFAKKPTVSSTTPLCTPVILALASGSR